MYFGPACDHFNVNLLVTFIRHPLALDSVLDILA